MFKGIRRRGRAGRGRLAALLAATALIASVVALVLWTREPVPLPGLIQGLPYAVNPEVGSEAFTRRLRERFAIGSPETELIRELWLEGFLPQTDLGAPLRRAVFEQPGICRSTAIVSWSADQTGRLGILSGGYNFVCL
jgi:hypothetical protein